MKGRLKHAMRAAALWVGMMFGTILSGLLVHPAPHIGRPDGPASVLVALLVVNALGAVVVSALAARFAASGLRKAMILFVVVFALETGFSSIESIVFGPSLGLTPGEVLNIAVAGLVRAIVTATVATLLWPNSAGATLQVSTGLPRLAAIVTLYVLLYFGAGFLIAWQSEAVRVFYKGGVGFNLSALAAVQIGRGVLWTGVVLLLATHVRGATGLVAAWIGATCAVLMVAPLLYPNAIMPWAVREVHLVEIAVANGLFGLFAVLILRRQGHARTLREPKAA